MKQDADVVMWSGGKDSMLATVLHLRSGHDPRSRRLVFVSTVDPIQGSFPSRFSYQDVKLVLQHCEFFGATAEIFFLPVDDKNCLVKNHNLVFRWLREKYTVNAVIRGDIFTDPATKESSPTTCFHRSLTEENLGASIIQPLTGLYVEDLFALLEKLSIKARVISVGRTCHFDLLEKDISLDLLKRVGLAGKRDFDECGEHGDYHTAVTQFGPTQFQLSEYRVHPKLNALLFDCAMPFSSLDSLPGVLDVGFIEHFTVATYESVQNATPFRLLEPKVQQNGG